MWAQNRFAQLCSRNETNGFPTFFSLRETSSFLFLKLDVLRYDICYFRNNMCVSLMTHDHGAMSAKSEWCLAWANFPTIEFSAPCSTPGKDKQKLTRISQFSFFLTLDCCAFSGWFESSYWGSGVTNSQQFVCTAGSSQTTKIRYRFVWVNLWAHRIGGTQK